MEWGRICNCIDGFSGKHVKIFIDGVPQEGAGAAFDLNNVPINFADRIEVYKGVVPVGFGTDAIGGVVNIVINKQPGKWFMDASYSHTCASDKRLRMVLCMKSMLFKTFRIMIIM